MGSQGRFGVAVCFVLRASSCLCGCPETRRHVRLTDPAPLSFWKNPAMASAEETRRPGRYSAGGGGRRRGPGRVDNARQDQGGRRWVKRFGGNHPADVVRTRRLWYVTVATPRRDSACSILEVAHRGGRRVQVAQFTRSLGAVVRDMRRSGRLRSWTDRADAGTKTDAGNTNGINVAPSRNKNELHRGLSKAHGQGWAAKGGFAAAERRRQWTSGQSMSEAAYAGGMQGRPP